MTCAAQSQVDHWGSTPCRYVRQACAIGSPCSDRSKYHTIRYATRKRGPVSIRHALLALLSKGPKYGLQLRQEFEAATGDVWPLNVGQVYTTLQRLERDGLVESDGSAEDGPQKGFHITEEGQRS